MSLWLSVDPLAEITMTPYQYTYQNPIRYIDPTGMAGEDEFDENGIKISDLGGDKIDFYHQKDGDTKVVDRESGESNMIRKGKSLIQGYTQREKNTNWGTLYDEFERGEGPTKSLISDFEDSTLGIFGSLDNKNSTYASKARTAVLSHGESKGKVAFNYTEINPLTAGFDGWEQFLGRTSVSYYKIGDKVLFMMNDSKSMTSLAYRLLPSRERSITNRLYGTTHQTYIWTETMKEVSQKGTLLYTPEQKVQMQVGQQGFSKWLR